MQDTNSDSNTNPMGKNDSNSNQIPQKETTENKQKQKPIDGQQQTSEAVQKFQPQQHIHQEKQAHKEDSQKMQSTVVERDEATIQNLNENTNGDNNQADYKLSNQNESKHQKQQKIKEQATNVVTSEELEEQTQKVPQLQQPQEPSSSETASKPNPTLTSPLPMVYYPSSFTTQNLPNVISKKVKGLVQTLNQPIININQLKKYLSEGIPDQANIIRQFCWKIILGYLPQNKNKWKQRIQKQTKTYFEFVQLFLPEEKFQNQYPILLKKGHQRYQELENDFSLWEQIQKDTSRTHAQLSFFCTPNNPQTTHPILIPYLTSPRREKFRLIYGEDQEIYKQFLGNKQMQRKTYRYDYMTRILYIYAKLNPQIQYVQGMNEILAPIFYLTTTINKQSQNSTSQSNTSTTTIDQAACFYMFNNAISDIIELHIKDLDKSENGIYGKLNEVNQMLVVIQPRIWSSLENLKIDPFFYCFRWMTLLFAQDFPLFDTLRLWQSIFSSITSRLEFMNFLALAIIISGKQVILNGDFTQVLEHLQNISEHVDVQNVIKIAMELEMEFKGYRFKEHAVKSKEKINEKMKGESSSGSGRMGRNSKQGQMGHPDQSQRQKSGTSNSISGKVTKFIGNLNKFFD